MDSLTSILSRQIATASIELLQAAFGLLAAAGIDSQVKPTMIGNFIMAVMFNINDMNVSKDIYHRPNHCQLAPANSASFLSIGGKKQLF